MKKKRHIFFRAGLVLFLLGLTTYYAWQFWEIDKKLEKSIKANIYESFGDRLRIDRIYLGLGAIFIRDLSFVPRDSLYTIWIKDIRLKYSLANLLKHGVKPAKIIEDVIINYPRITVYVKDTGNADSISGGIGLPPDLEAKLKSATFLNRLAINQGEVFLKTDANPIPVRIFDQANGWIETDHSGRAVAKLAARLFRSNQHNVILSSYLNLKKSLIDSICIDIHDFQFDKPIPFLNLSYVQIKEGILQGHIRVSHDPDTNQFPISGWVSVQDGAMQIQNAGLFFDKAQVKIRVENWNLFVEDSSKVLLNNTPVYLGGEIRNVLNPDLNLWAQASHLDLKTFLGKLYPGQPIPIAGKGTVRLRIQNSIRNPAFSGVFMADSLRLSRFRFDDVRFIMAMQDSVFYLSKLSAKNQDSQLQGWGQIHLNSESKKMRMSVIVNGNLTNSMASLTPLKFPDTRGTILIDFQGPLAHPTVNGNFDLFMGGRNQEQLNFLGNFRVKKRGITFEAGTSDTSFIMVGRVDHFLDDPSFDLQAQNMTRLAGLFKMPVARAFADRYNLNGEIKGQAQAFDLNLIAIAKSTATKELMAHLSLSRNADSAKAISGTLTFYPESEKPVATQLTGVLTDSEFVVTSLGNENWLSGQLSMGLEGDQRIRGIIKLSGAELKKIFGNGDSNPPKYDGKLFAEVKLNGTVKDPHIQVDGWLLNGFFNGDGIFSGELSGLYERSGFRLDKFQITYEGNPYLQAKGKVQFSPVFVDLNIKGSDVNANTLIHAITGEKDVLLGKADIDMQLKGRNWPINMYGKIHLRKGKVVWFTFDDLIFDLGDLAKGGNGSVLASDGFHIGNISYVKEGQYVLNGNGILPLNKTDSMKVELQGFGNFLSCLPDFASVFSETQSVGELKLMLLGPYKKLRLANTHAKILTGKLRLSTVAKEIRDISGEAETEGDFIHIKNLSGRIGDAQFNIRNYRNTPVKSGHLGTPLRIGNDWMSLGTIVAESSKNGLPLHIPALMEKREFGRFWIKGRKGEPGFLIAGPWKHPVFRGEIVLANVNLMFPFDESGDEVDPLLTNILMNIDWDVLAIAGQDNRYVKKIPSGINNVYVNISIDDEVSRLLFTGIFRDTSSTFLPGLTFEKGENGGAINSTPVASVPVIPPDTAGASDLQFLVGNSPGHRPEGPDTSSFRMEGVIESTRGNIEYLDLNFRVDKFGAVWDRSELEPMVYGRAWTTVTDSTNFPQNVYLKIYARDPTTGEERSRGRWEYTYFKLESENPTYNSSQLELLATLGYSLKNVKEKATDMIGISTDNLLFRPLLRPVERTLEHSLGLDIVKLNSRFTRNFLEMNLGQPIETKMALLRSTKLTIGKYLSSRLFLLYTGQVEAWPHNYRFQEPNFGLRHTFGLEYRFNPGLLLQMEYDVNNAYEFQREDKKIWIRHSFPLK